VNRTYSFVHRFFFMFGISLEITQGVVWLCRKAIETGNEAHKWSGCLLGIALIYRCVHTSCIILLIMLYLWSKWIKMYACICKYDVKNDNWKKLKYRNMMFDADWLSIWIEKYIVHLAIFISSVLFPR
jgi:hypothetical protein